MFEKRAGQSRELPVCEGVYFVEIGGPFCSWIFYAWHMSGGRYGLRLCDLAAERVSDQIDGYLD